MPIRSRYARDAYSSRDSELSRAIHQSTELAELAAGKSDFLHGRPPSSNFMKSHLSAALRGTVGAGLLLCCLLNVSSNFNFQFWSLGIVLISSLSFFTVWSDERLLMEFTEFEKQREKWEVENFPEGEIQEMLQIYTGYGLSENDAMKVAQTLAKYPEFWVDHMLLHEIGIVPRKPSDPDDDESILQGLLPHVIFFAQFLGPTIGVWIGSSLVAGTLLGIQGFLLVVLQRRQSQWLSVSTIIGFVVTYALTCGVILTVGRILTATL
jgi:hypothetical protein